MGLLLQEQRARGLKGRRSASLAALVALGLGLSGLFAGLGRAQTLTADDQVFFRTPGFRIPFHAEPGDNRIVEVKFFVSEDQARSWVPVGKAPANAGGFNYQAEHDGSYWFTVQTVDRDGRLYPASIQGAQPGLKVYVKTKPPTVALRATQFQDGTLKAEWQVLDDYLKLDTLALSWRLNANYQWVPLSLPRLVAAGSHTWNPGTNAPVDVRLEIRDRADNLGTAQVSSTSINGGTPAGGAPPAQLTRDVRILNSKQVTLTYEIEGVGRSGIKTLEVWRTRDGGKWESDSAHEVNKATDFQPVTISLPAQDGTYGYTLTAKSNAGLGEGQPRGGDSPQVWIEVDRTPPDVHILSVEVGKGADLGKLVVQYTANDKNFSRQPIMIYYASAVEPTEPLDWKPMSTSGPLENTGRFVWNLPVDIPYLLYIKVDALDRAGNTGSVVWGAPDKKAINVDLAQPKVIFKEIRIPDPAQPRP